MELEGGPGACLAGAFVQMMIWSIELFDHFIQDVQGG
jgi:hypothetical protein